MTDDAAPTLEDAEALEDAVPVTEDDESPPNDPVTEETA